MLPITRRFSVCSWRAALFGCVRRSVARGLDQGLDALLAGSDARRSHLRTSHRPSGALWASPPCRGHVADSYVPLPGYATGAPDRCQREDDTFADSLHAQCKGGQQAPVASRSPAVLRLVRCQGAGMIRQPPRFLSGGLSSRPSPGRVASRKVAEHLDFPAAAGARVAAMIASRSDEPGSQRERPRPGRLESPSVVAAVPRCPPRPSMPLPRRPLPSSSEHPDRVRHQAGLTAIAQGAASLVPAQLRYVQIEGRRA